MLMAVVRWRRHRRAAHEGFCPRNIASHQYLQGKSSALLASRIFDDPDNWMRHIESSVASITLGSVYGKHIVDANAGIIQKRMQGIADSIQYAARPGNYLVDILPWMFHLPSWMAQWKRDGQQWFERNTVFLNGLVREVEQNMVRLSCSACRVEPGWLVAR